MISGLSFPVLLFLFFETPSFLFKIFAVLVSIALVATHRKNISRLLKGEEKKLFRYRKKI
jgi:glycerol-3-phosphate acyltransferase PlsY